jgi:hypothetical protein
MNGPQATPQSAQVDSRNVVRIDCAGVPVSWGQRHTEQASKTSRMQDLGRKEERTANPAPKTQTIFQHILTIILREHLLVSDIESEKENNNRDGVC